MDDRAPGRFGYPRAAARYEARARARHELEQQAIGAARAVAVHIPCAALDDERFMGLMNELAEAIRRLDAFDTPTRSPSP